MPKKVQKPRPALPLNLDHLATPEDESLLVDHSMAKPTLEQIAQISTGQPIQSKPPTPRKTTPPKQAPAPAPASVDLLPDTAPDLHALQTALMWKEAEASVALDGSTYCCEDDIPRSAPGGIRGDRQQTEDSRIDEVQRWWTRSGKRPKYFRTVLASGVLRWTNLSPAQQTAIHKFIAAGFEDRETLRKIVRFTDSLKTAVSPKRRYRFAQTILGMNALQALGVETK